MKYENSNRYARRGMSRRMIAVLAALLVLMLTATAVAVVRGNLLRTKLETQGDETIAAQVHDVYAADAADGFSFSIDEVVSEDNRYYLSYTVAVPDDGNTYLYGVHIPELNGVEMGIKTNGYFDTAFGAGELYAMGGDYPSRFSTILNLEATPGTEARAENELSMRVTFFRTRSAVEVVDDEELAAHATIHDDRYGDLPILAGTDVLYATSVTEGEAGAIPMVYLLYYGPVQELQEERVDAINAREDITSREKWDLIAAVSVDAQDVVDIGIATEIAAEREVRVALDLSENQETVYNDVAQHFFEMDGYSIEITDFRLSHFGASFRLLIRKDEEVNYTEYGVDDFYDGHPHDSLADEPLARSYVLCTRDGTELDMCWSIPSAAWDGKNGLIGIQILGALKELYRSMI